MLPGCSCVVNQRCAGQLLIFDGCKILKATMLLGSPSVPILWTNTWRQQGRIFNRHNLNWGVGCGHVKIVELDELQAQCGRKTSIAKSPQRKVTTGCHNSRQKSLMTPSRSLHNCSCACNCNGDCRCWLHHVADQSESFKIYLLLFFPLVFWKEELTKNKNPDKSQKSWNILSTYTHTFFVLNIPLPVWLL